MISRRGFLVGALAVAGAGLVGAVVVTRSSDDVGEISGHLAATFPYLLIPEAEREAFAEAYVGLYGPPGGPGWNHVDSTFLLSTDFFPDADEARTVRFTRIYGPYASPCSNPMATLV